MGTSVRTIILFISISLKKKKIENIVEKKLQENISEVIVVSWISLHNIEGFSHEGESPGKKIVFLVTAETSASLEGCF